MTKSFEIKLDVEKVLYSPMQILFSVSNNDVDSIELLFEFTQDDESFDLTGKDVQLAIQKPSRKVTYETIEITDPIKGKASARLSHNSYSEYGIHIAEVYIKDTETTIVTSPFYFNTWESIIDIPEENEVLEWDNIMNKPLTFPPEPHTHEIADVNGLQDALDSKTEDTRPLEPHTHAIADVNGLQIILDGKADDIDLEAKADAIHTHDFATLTNLPASYPPDVHVHEIGDVAGLTDTLGTKADVEDLNAKADVIHTHDFVDLTNVPTSFPPDAHVHTSAEISDFTTGVAGAIPPEYLTESEGDTRYQGAGTVPEHTHDETEITFNGINAKTYVDNADNYILNTRMAGLTLWKGTQAEYDAIATPDAETLYFIVG